MEQHTASTLAPTPATRRFPHRDYPFPRKPDSQGRCRRRQLQITNQPSTQKPAVRPSNPAQGPHPRPHALRRLIPDTPNTVRFGENFGFVANLDHASYKSNPKTTSPPPSPPSSHPNPEPRRNASVRPEPVEGGRGSLPPSGGRLGWGSPPPAPSPHPDTSPFPQPQPPRYPPPMEQHTASTLAPMRPSNAGSASTTTCASAPDSRRLFVSAKILAL